MRISSFAPITRFVCGACLTLVAVSARAADDPIASELAARRNDFGFQFDDVGALCGVLSQGRATPTIAGSLRIDSIQISRPELRALAAQKSLRSLSLGYSNLVDDDLSELRALPRLEFLGLVGTRVTDDALQSIVAFPMLKKLDLRESSCSPEAISRLENASNIVVVSGLTSETYAARLIRDERRNLIVEPMRLKADAKPSGLCFRGGDIDDAALDRLVVGPHLERLSFRKTAVSATRLQTLFAAASQLQAIGLADVALTVELATTLAKLRGLHYLDLRGCHIDESALAALARSCSLRYLMLPSDGVRDDDLAALAEVASLIELDVTATAVSDAGLAHFTNHNHLTLFNAHHTDITLEAAAKLERRLPGCRVFARPRSEPKK